MLSQYDYSVEFRKTWEHGNADVLSRLPAGSDHGFDGEEMGDDVDNVCTVRMISRQIMQDDPKLLVKETNKDPVLTQVMRCVKEGWAKKCSDELQDYKKLDDSLSTEHGCLFHGSRVVIPASLQDHVLDLLHLGHIGMQRMKQLARSTVYWPRIGQDMENQSTVYCLC